LKKKQGWLGIFPWSVELTLLGVFRSRGKRTRAGEINLVTRVIGKKRARGKKRKGRGVKMASHGNSVSFQTPGEPNEPHLSYTRTSSEIVIEKEYDGGNKRGRARSTKGEEEGGSKKKG